MNVRKTIQLSNIQNGQRVLMQGAKACTLVVLNGSAATISVSVFAVHDFPGVAGDFAQSLGAMSITTAQPIGFLTLPYIPNLLYFISTGGTPVSAVLYLDYDM